MKRIKSYDSFLKAKAEKMHAALKAIVRIKDISQSSEVYVPLVLFFIMHYRHGRRKLHKTQFANGRICWAVS